MTTNKPTSGPPETFSYKPSGIAVVLVVVLMPVMAFILYKVLLAKDPTMADYMRTWLKLLLITLALGVSVWSAFAWRVAPDCLKVDERGLTTYKLGKALVFVRWADIARIKLPNRMPLLKIYNAAGQKVMTLPTKDIDRLLELIMARAPTLHSKTVNQREFAWPKFGSLALLIIPAVLVGSILEEDKGLESLSFYDASLSVCVIALFVTMFVYTLYHGLLKLTVTGEGIQLGYAIGTRFIPFREISNVVVATPPPSIYWYRYRDNSATVTVMLCNGEKLEFSENEKKGDEGVVFEAVKQAWQHHLSGHPSSSKAPKV